MDKERAQRLGAAIEEIKHILDIDFKNVPVSDFTEQRLAMEYMRLTVPGERYAPDVTRDDFFILEGQASWVVLRKIGESDEQISGYENAQRQRIFRHELQKDPDNFCFYEQREKAIKNLDDLGIIDGEESLSS